VCLPPQPLCLGIHKCRVSHLAQLRLAGQNFPSVQKDQEDLVDLAIPSPQRHPDIRPRPVSRDGLVDPRDQSRRHPQAGREQYVLQESRPCLQWAQVVHLAPLVLEGHPRRVFQALRRILVSQECLHHQDRLGSLGDLAVLSVLAGMANMVAARKLFPVYMKRWVLSQVCRALRPGRDYRAVLGDRHHP